LIGPWWRGRALELAPGGPADRPVYLIIGLMLDYVPAAG
jgi:hypothetical protein